MLVLIRDVDEETVFSHGLIYLCIMWNVCLWGFSTLAAWCAVVAAWRNVKKKCPSFRYYYLWYLVIVTPYDIWQLKEYVVIYSYIILTLWLALDSIVLCKTQWVTLSVIWSVCTFRLMSNYYVSDTGGGKTFISSFNFFFSNFNFNIYQ